MSTVSDVVPEVDDNVPLEVAFTAMLSQFSQAVYTTLPYTLSVYMVRNFEGAGATEESVGRHTGFLTSATPAAQALTSVLWGTMSDKLGKKPVLMMANAAAALSLTALGWSSNLMSAILILFLGGIFTSGNGVVIKSIVAEAGSAARQAKVVSYATTGWGLGTVLGPIIGGLLASPCMAYGSTFPWCGNGQLLENRPFLLPCLACGALATMACLQTLYIKEKRWQQQLQRYGTEHYSLWEARKELVVAMGYDSSRVVPAQSECMVQLTRLQGGTQQDCVQTVVHDVNEENAALLHGALSSSPSGPPMTDGVNRQQQHTHDASVSIHANNTMNPSWYKNGLVLTCLFGSAICTAACSYLDGLLPLLASATIPMGGLGLPTQRLSMPMAFGGLVLALYSFFIYPMQQKACGVYTSLQMGLLSFMPIAMLIPFSTFYASTAPTISIAILFVTIGFRSIAKTSIMSSSTVLINFVAPLAQVGAVTGAGQMLQSIGRSLAPILAGYAWGLAMSLSLVGRQYLPFVGVLLGSSMSLGLYSTIRWQLA